MEYALVLARRLCGGIASGTNGGPLDFRCENYGLVLPTALLRSCIQD